MYAKPRYGNSFHYSVGTLSALSRWCHSTLGSTMPREDVEEKDTLQSGEVLKPRDTGMHLLKFRNWNGRFAQSKSSQTSSRTRFPSRLRPPSKIRIFPLVTALSNPKSGFFSSKKSGFGLSNEIALFSDRSSVIGAKPVCKKSGFFSKCVIF
eukprot:Lithocolla_globosa_v1_NODE_290_length_4624_cov_1165.781571.p5 type:complete len:152 gc:universal NODE_290_length_4624_cov_1165.781571:1527-1072(-)